MKKKMISVVAVIAVTLLGRGFVANNLLAEGNFLKLQTSEFSFGYTSGVCTHSEIKLIYKPIGGQAGSSQHNVYEKCKAPNCNYEKFLCTENHTLGTIIYYSSDEAKAKFGSNYSEGSHYYTKCSKGCGQAFAQEHNWESILIPENEVAGYGWPTDENHYYWNACAQCKEQKKNAAGGRIATPVKHVFEMGKCRLCPKLQEGYYNTSNLENAFNGSTIEFYYKGKRIKISSNMFKEMMNIVNHESGNSLAQRIAVFQIILNQYINGGAIYFSPNYDPASNHEWNLSDDGFNEYLDQTKDAINNVINNSALSNEVSNAIGDATVYAGDADGEGYKDRLRSYEGTVEIDQGSVLWVEQGGQNTIFGTTYPDQCSKCKSYLYSSNYCSTCKRYCCGNERCRYHDKAISAYVKVILNTDGTCPNEENHI